MFHSFILRIHYFNLPYFIYIIQSINIQIFVLEGVNVLGKSFIIINYYYLIVYVLIIGHDQSSTTLLYCRA